MKIGSLFTRGAIDSAGGQGEFRAGRKYAQVDLDNVYFLADDV